MQALAEPVPTCKQLLASLAKSSVHLVVGFASTCVIIAWKRQSIVIEQHDITCKSATFSVQQMLNPHERWACRMQHAISDGSILPRLQLMLSLRQLCIWDAAQRVVCERAPSTVQKTTTSVCKFHLPGDAPCSAAMFCSYHLFCMTVRHQAAQGFLQQQLTAGRSCSRSQHGNDLQGLARQ